MIRLGAVSYLNAKPLVYGLEAEPRFDVRFDVPAQCAELLHAGDIDLGLIPSIEYLRGGPDAYRVAPGVAIASQGPVASVALYTRRDPRDVRSVAMDTSSRTSVALSAVLLKRAYGVQPTAMDVAPNLAVMLARADAALLIGDVALMLADGAEGATKIDLGEVCCTGLPFVYAFWAGRPGVLRSADIEALQRTRDVGVGKAREIAQRHFDDPAEQAIGAAYLRDNIKFDLGADEQAGLERFYRYAAELDLVGAASPIRFY